MKTKPYLLSMLLAVVLLASGCIAYQPEPDDAQANDDAEAGTHGGDDAANSGDDEEATVECNADSSSAANVVGGSEDKTATFSVGSGCTHVELTGSWNAGASIDFKLEDPRGNVKWQNDPSGASAQPPRELYSQTDNVAGDWVLSIDLSGGGNYDFTFTWS